MAIYIKWLQMLFGKMFPVNTGQSLQTKSKEIKQGLPGTRKSSRAPGVAPSAPGH